MCVSCVKIIKNRITNNEGNAIHIENLGLKLKIITFFKKQQDN
jgi:hypothetical protein